MNGGMCIDKIDSSINSSALIFVFTRTAAAIVVTFCRPGCKPIADRNPVNGGTRDEQQVSFQGEYFGRYSCFT